MVGDEISLTSAVCQILTVGLCHYALAWLRFRSRSVAALLDGVPLILLEHKQWRTDTLSRMRIQDDDVIDLTRDQASKTSPGEPQQEIIDGMKLRPEDLEAAGRTANVTRIEDIDYAILERNGRISVFPKEDK
jgi:uncharacterized membrane protein YcaP (DUF421 family)